MEETDPITGEKKKVSYPYPSWAVDATDNTKVNLDLAAGTVMTPGGYKCTKGILKVYKPSAVIPGGYETTPALTCEANNPGPIVLNQQQIAWGDDNKTKIKFDNGVTVKLTVRLTFEKTDDPGKGSTYDADAPESSSKTDVHK
ncbi:MAG: hypothetical protein K2X87_21845 [Gemmataceae bacterium]|nr:hypothetical protein [Gemmataceae bacterium]